MMWAPGCVLRCLDGGLDGGLKRVWIAGLCGGGVVELGLGEGGGEVAYVVRTFSTSAPHELWPSVCHLKHVDLWRSVRLARCLRS